MVIASLCSGVGSIWDHRWSHGGDALLFKDSSPRGWLRRVTTTAKERGCVTLDSARGKARLGTCRVLKNSNAAKSGARRTGSEREFHRAGQGVCTLSSRQGCFHRWECPDQICVCKALTLFRDWVGATLRSRLSGCCGIARKHVYGNMA